MFTGSLHGKTGFILVLSWSPLENGDDKKQEIKQKICAKSNSVIDGARPRREGLSLAKLLIRTGYICLHLLHFPYLRGPKRALYPGLALVAGNTHH